MKQLCERYAVSRSGYYAWKSRGQRAHDEQDRWLMQRIQGVYTASAGTYGAPRICKALGQAHIGVSRKRVARLMRQAGLRARARLIYRSKPGTHEFYASIPSRIHENLETGADQVWVGDLTYLRVGENWRYLAVVMDRYTRRIVGWSLGGNKEAKLTLRALNNAIARRKAQEGLIFHSDRGVEYGAYECRARLAALGIVQSMNRPGRPGDNAHMESFCHSLKSDVIHGVKIESDGQLREIIRRSATFATTTVDACTLDWITILQSSLSEWRRS